MKNNMKNNKSAFTLIELLVVVAIIGILSTLAVIALQSSRADSRDAKRLADVRQIQKALEMYFLENGSYPSDISSGIASGTTIYMAQIPVAPTPADGECPSYNNTYTYTASSSSYTLDFCLGSKTGEFNAGGKRATNEGIISYTPSPPPPPPFECGSTLTDSRDSNQYPTVLIGSQCWMAKNLAYLPSVQTNADFVTYGNNSQPAYGVYDYTGTDVAAAKATANYQTYGVLYNWFAAVATSSTTGTEETQGVCPVGWHLPSSAEFITLFTTLGNDGGKLKQSGTTTWYSPNAGATNLSGFTALPAGSRKDASDAFSSMGYFAYFWSSSFSSPNALNRYLIYHNTSFYSNSSSPVFGYSVRCLKN
jgi:uncharacterized protein (TIGR02145 family)/prepilin-type N-terminal cleavage/methylation domain-containing protein